MNVLPLVLVLLPTVPLHSLFPSSLSATAHSLVEYSVTWVCNFSSDGKSQGQVVPPFGDILGFSWFAIY